MSSESTGAEKAETTTSLRDKVSREEWECRTNLAAMFRYAALRGWDDHLFTHMSARVPGTDGDFLLNPIGTLYEEITASSLQRFNKQGEIQPPSTGRPNVFVLPMYVALFGAVPQVQCLIHLHAEAGIAVSMQPHGLLRSSQYALLVGRIGYHEYEGIAMNREELSRLSGLLVDHDCIILRGHGLLVRGGSIYEAFIRTHHLIKACEVQLAAQACGQPLYAMGKNALEVTEREARNINNPDLPLGQASWRALMRRLDRIDPGYRD